jgi:TetR/AcrR family transcriptional regulator, mexJK operon transcriptional repressor
MDKRSKRDIQREATREVILNTALNLFIEQGFKGTSTRRIAEVAGVSEGLIFHHFATKKDLLAGLGETRGVMADQVITLMDDANEIPASILVPSMGRRFVAMFTADDVDARLFRILLAESPSDPELRVALQEKSTSVIESLANYLTARIAAGELRSDLNCSAAAKSLLGSFLWHFLIGTQTTEANGLTELTQYADQVIELWMNGAAVRK